MNVSDSLSFVAILVILSAWLNSIIHCLLAAKYLLLMVSVFMPPVGIIHGAGLWFGVSW